jgi:hypothetical protein
MSVWGAADEWDLIVPADGAELLAELGRHGIRPGQRLRVISGTPGDDSAVETWPPPWIGSFDSDDPHLAEHSEEILRAELGRS